MQFKQNKYTKWYFNIINNPDITATYTELHHIIPAGMGGSDDKENLVRLSARQHFIAHLLLIKMTDGENRSKAISAIRQMRRASKGQERYIPSSKIFAMIKQLMSEQQRERMIRLWQDPEYRAGQKATADRMKLDPGYSEKKRIAALKANQNPLTSERRRIAALNRPKHSEETKQKMRDKWASKNGVARKYLPREDKPKRWKAISPMQEVFEFDVLKDFCALHNLHRPTLAFYAKLNQVVPSMKRTRFDTSKERNLSIGWYLQKI
jgi:hypothetical protein